MSGQIILVPVPRYGFCELAEQYSPTKEFKEKLVSVASKHAEEVSLVVFFLYFTRRAWRSEQQGRS